MAFMRSYGQYCPISRASEILAERWTPLVIRNLLLGATRFGDIAGGLPGMSRSLLSSRLRRLEDAGIVTSKSLEGRRGREYLLTEAGRELWDVIEPMAAWANRWLELQPEHTDPSFALWAWVHVHLNTSKLPKRRTVVSFLFPQQPPAYRRFWLLVEDGRAELCYRDPGFDVDLEIKAKSQSFTEWHIGKLNWGQAVKSGDITVTGPRTLAKQVPTWNQRATVTR